VGVAGHGGRALRRRKTPFKSLTLQGTAITYATGNPNEMAVTDTTLRLTTLQAGGDSGYLPVGYSDLIRLTTFNPGGYGTCQ
jgi:hypothetical protein